MLDGEGERVRARSAVLTILMMKRLDKGVSCLVPKLRARKENETCLYSI
jgi:hypothetical protein